MTFPLSFKRLLIYFLSLFIVSVSLSSCGGDDDDGGGEIMDQPFLEKYHGTVWEGNLNYTGEPSSSKGYLRFRDSQTSILETWEIDDYFEETCYDKDILDLKDLGDGEILENLNNKLKFFNSENDDTTIYWTQTVTMTVTGDNLNILVVYDDFYDDDSGEFSFTLKRSTVNVENLKECDYGW